MQQTSVTLTDRLAGVKVAGISLAGILGMILVYSTWNVNRLNAKLMKQQAARLTSLGFPQNEDILDKAFAEIDSIAGINKSDDIDSTQTTAPTPTPSATKSANGLDAAAMVEGDPTQFINEYNALKDYSAPQIGGGFAGSW